MTAACHAVMHIIYEYGYGGILLLVRIRVLGTDMILSDMNTAGAGPGDKRYRQARAHDTQGPLGSGRGHEMGDGGSGWNGGVEVVQQEDAEEPEVRNGAD